MFPTVVITGHRRDLHGHPQLLQPLHHAGAGAHRLELIIIGVVVAFSEATGSRRWPGGCCWARSAELLLQVPAGLEAPLEARVVDGEYVDWPAKQSLGAARRARSPWRMASRSPKVKRVGMLLGPVIISLGIINFNSFIGTMMATLIHMKAICGSGHHRRGVPALPTTAGHVRHRHRDGAVPGSLAPWRRQRMEEFREDLSLGLRQIFFVTLPFAAFFSVLAVPTIRLIYEHGMVTGDEAAPARWPPRCSSSASAWPS